MTFMSLAFMQKAKFGTMVDIVSTQLQLTRSLRGMTSELGSFVEAGFSEEALEQRLEHEPRLATCWYWIHKLQAQFLAGDYHGAVAAAARARPFLWTMPSFPEIADYAFYAALACFGTEFLLYAYLLSSLNLIVAYPILVSLGYLAIIGLSKAFLGETFRPVNWLGAAVIVAGVWLVGTP